MGMMKLCVSCTHTVPHAAWGVLIRAAALVRAMQCNAGRRRDDAEESKEGREKRTYKDPNPIFGALRMS